MKPDQIITIGVYGFSEEGFFRALQEAGVDTFCDLRQRRGLRGAKYAFANSKRLQARLAELGIRYLHRKDLAPTKAIRQRQKEADKKRKTAKRERDALSPAFVNAYREEILADFAPQSLWEELPENAQVVALFCVERAPAACHRSLVAEKLAQDPAVSVTHITPGDD
jgi:uncharacterized protein (DUF488 family)